jgi:hypothetical protein
MASGQNISAVLLAAPHPTLRRRDIIHDQAAGCTARLAQ